MINENDYVRPRVKRDIGVKLYKFLFTSNDPDLRELAEKVAALCITKEIRAGEPISILINEPTFESAPKPKFVQKPSDPNATLEEKLANYRQNLADEQAFNEEHFESS